MKQVVSVVCGIMLTAFNLYSEAQPKADAYFRVTDELPKYKDWGWYNGILSVTNTGGIAFAVVTDRGWSGEAVRFYQEGDEKQQRVEEERGRVRQRREQERAWALDAYNISIEKYPETVKTLQPGESVSFECKVVFQLPFDVPGGVYKAEMYLGHDTWVSVHITPTLGTLYALEWGKDGKPTGNFYYYQAGTNQYLYVKVEEKFKRVAELKLDSRPEKKKDEETVTFQSPDGTRKTLTREQAAEIIREREQQNP